jgi:hypothetical protein
MISPFGYKIPKTLQEACDLLWQAEGKAKIIAGGTDLVIGLRNGDQKPPFTCPPSLLNGLTEDDEACSELGRSS